MSRRPEMEKRPTPKLPAAPRKLELAKKEQHFLGRSAVATG